VSNSFPQAQKQLAILVKTRRLVLGISQEELAHQAGIDRTYASQIERGIGNPSLKVICGIADALGLEPHSLIATVTKN
jgi:transcriptional regulator with XRE-family HTH domain